jgi:hypothetical protein
MQSVVKQTSRFLLLRITILSMIISKIKQLINHKINQIYLQLFCQYLGKDICGNHLYQAYDLDFNKIIHCSGDRYLICYVDIFTNDCFEETHITNMELIFNF